MSSFVVVGRAPASAILREGEILVVDTEVETLGPVKIAFQTRYLGVEEGNNPLPTGMRFEVFEEAPDRDRSFRLLERCFKLRALS